MRISVSLEICTVSAEADSDEQDAGLCFFVPAHIEGRLRDALFSVRFFRGFGSTG